MDLLERILGANNRRGGSNDFFDTLRGLSRWVVSCGCALLLGIVFLVILIVGGAIQLGNEAITIAVVVAMIIVAVVSLFRASFS